MISYNTCLSPSDLTSFSVTISRSIHVDANNKFSFFLWLIFFVSIYNIFFIHLSVDGHLGCFHVLAVVNSAAVNIGVHVSFWIMFVSEYMPRSGIEGSYSSSIFSFHRKFHSVLPSGCTNIQSHQQCRRIPISPHPLQQILFVNFWLLPFWLKCHSFRVPEELWMEVHDFVQEAVIKTIPKKKKCKKAK